MGLSRADQLFQDVLPLLHGLGSLGDALITDEIAPVNELGKRPVRAWYTIKWHNLGFLHARKGDFSIQMKRHCFSGSSEQLAIVPRRGDMCVFSSKGNVMSLVRLGSHHGEAYRVDSDVQLLRRADASVGTRTLGD